MSADFKVGFYRIFCELKIQCFSTFFVVINCVTYGTKITRSSKIIYTVSQLSISNCFLIFDSQFSQNIRFGIILKTINIYFINNYFIIYFLFSFVTISWSSNFFKLIYDFFSGFGPLFNNLISLSKRYYSIIFNIRFNVNIGFLYFFGHSFADGKICYLNQYLCCACKIFTRL